MSLGELSALDVDPGRRTRRDRARPPLPVVPTVLCPPPRIGIPAGFARRGDRRGGGGRCWGGSGGSDRRGVRSLLSEACELVAVDRGVGVIEHDVWGVLRQGDRWGRLLRSGHGHRRCRRRDRCGGRREARRRGRLRSRRRPGGARVTRPGGRHRWRPHRVHLGRRVGRRNRRHRCMGSSGGWRGRCGGWRGRSGGWREHSRWLGGHRLLEDWGVHVGGPALTAEPVGGVPARCAA